MAACAREMIFDTIDGVRLQGFHSPAPGRGEKGLVILLHGWEGSASSTYILHSGRFLHARGYDVFRLNLRDHGDTHHLNEGLFYATLIDEAFSAVKQAARLARGGGVYLAGFSLGGNFALRIAGRCAHEPIEALRHVMAVSPVVDPARATRAIDRSGLLRWYFLKKWRRSLRRKQALYPDRYDFSGLLPIQSIGSLTDALIRASGVYHSSEEYFRGYTITGPDLEQATVPVTIVISRDDPAIPADDFIGLRLAPHGKLIIHNYGGHNGFLSSLLGATWYEERMLDLF
jgi:predicted alpha/beta-fold hydrolase